MHTINPEIWESQGGRLQFCACQGSVSINGGNAVVSEIGDCVPDSNICYCWDLTIDAADCTASDDGQVHVFAQCCDGSWQNEALGAGAWARCYLQFFGFYILSGGVYVPATYSNGGAGGRCGSECSPAFGGCNC